MRVSGLVAAMLRGLRMALIGAGIALAPAAVILACSDVIEPTGSDTRFPLVYGDRPTVADLTELGRRMFFDPTLSASGTLSCASCHDPARAYGPPDARVVPQGGVGMDRSGFRSAPALTYLHSPIAFTEHFYEPEVNGGKDDEGPTGGRTWDGRVNTGHDQALMPLLDANEMANANVGEVATRLRKASYSAEFARAVSAPGEDVLADPEASVGWLTVALAVFEQSGEFHPFTSKFDAYLRDEVELSSAEQRGMTAFNDMKKGNCASCHPSTRKSSSDHLPIFTDFGYAALAVPRNRALAANADPTFHDLGVCGPLRVDLQKRTEYCGLFRTPTLRNVALRRNFFHNGAIHSLRDAVEFYATRDVHPERWYGRGTSGRIERFDDLPEAYWKNVNVDVPFKPRLGGRPRLTEREVDDIVAFLKTLTDGYQAPPAARWSQQAKVDAPSTSRGP